MKATWRLQRLGQSLWLDDLSRGLLNDGRLREYIDTLCVTGLTSNPTLFYHAIRASDAYDDGIRRTARAGLTTEALFYELALEDVVRAADEFEATHESSAGLDGWVSLEVSPLLAADAADSVATAAELHARAQRSNLFIKLPGTAAGLVAIEAAIFRGIPINVTLLFSRAQYLAAAAACLRGIERRIAAGLDPRIASIASIFVSRLDAAVNDCLPDALRNRLGIAVAGQVYAAYRDLLTSVRWRAPGAAGARAPRVLWASTGVKDPRARDTLYVDALAAPDTVDTMPERTLLAYADHGDPQGVMSTDTGDADDVLAAVAGHGVDPDALAARLQREGIEAFSRSWREMLACIDAKRGTPRLECSDAAP